MAIRFWMNFLRLQRGTGEVDLMARSACGVRVMPFQIRHGLGFVSGFFAFAARGFVALVARGAVC